MKITLFIQLIRNMGMRYTFYRIRYELEQKFGVIKKRHPTNPPHKKNISLAEWKRLEISLVVDAKENLQIEKRVSQELKVKAERILSGELLFFSSEWKELGRNYDWITNPDSGYKYDVSKHWSEIPDLSKEAGDIKFVWEKSRFSYLLSLIRYDYHSEKDLSEFVFSEIENWIDANPINQGPNWRCSQETSLRIFNWCYALSYYKNSSALTEKRWGKIQNVIYWSLHHVYHHIDFSRVAVRNNHSITETLFLSLSNLLFPFIPQTKEWSEKGRKWVEEEIDYQVYEDGTFLQFSMNYHRVLIQLFSLGITVSEKHNQPFSKNFYEKAYKSLNFLFQCMQEENGWLPNYGSNDGAWFFPLSDTDYRDYRPQLNTLHLLLTGQKLFENKQYTEDLWRTNESLGKLKPLIKIYNSPLSFENGGYYLLRQLDFFTFIRCGSHKDRPAQADNLHLDIWHKNENILRDSGTYKYNTDHEKLNYFMGSLSHNTVMVENNSQMLKGERFIWYYWTQKKFAQWKETETEYIFEGEITAFTFLNKNASQKRVIKINKQNPHWTITDTVSNLDGKKKKQIWHPNSTNFEIKSGNKEKIEIESYNSNYYGQLTKEKSFYFEFDNNIETLFQYK